MNEQFMQRALQVATLGRGHVSPNPMVGCVIEHHGRIIGEGWHQRYGEAHAERNAIAAIKPEDRPLIPQSTAYVTLEPCAHYGKQPPCADLLIQERIGRVVVCNQDPNPLVAGQGLQRLRKAGMEVFTGMLEAEGRNLNARFFTFIEQNRPYVILKWAQSADGFMAAADRRPVAISGPLAQRLVHRWRSEEDAILVGSTTARTDNPHLTTRYWPGRSPIRIVLDRTLSLPQTLHLFDGSVPTLVFHNAKNLNPNDRPNGTYIAAETLPDILHALRQRQIQSVLVEGGATILNAFLELGLWDEMRVLQSPTLLGQGIKAPTIQGRLAVQTRIGPDEISIRLHKT